MTLLVLVLVFSIVVGEIEDCVFDGLKLGSESSSVDQVFEWVVHVLWWRCGVCDVYVMCVVWCV